MTFGDPYRDQVLAGELESRRETFCAAGDFICEGKPFVLPPHLSYGKVGELLRHSKDNMKG